MNAQQEAVALYQFLERRGYHPSVRSVGRILRDELGLKFRESSLRSWLGAFCQIRDASGTQLSLVRDAVGTRLRARNKVSLVSNKSATQTPPPKAAAIASKRKDRSPAQIVADAALELIRARVEPVLAGMTISTWKQRSRGVATEMAASGMTASDIDAAHLEHSEHRGRVTVMLLYVQRDLASRPASQPEQLIEDVLPADELARLRAKIIAKRAAEDAKLQSRAAQ